VRPSRSACECAGCRLLRGALTLAVRSNDWQFYPPELLELQRRETAAYQRSVGYKVPLREVKEGEDASEAEEERKTEQEFIESGEACLLAGSHGTRADCISQLRR